MRSEECYCLDRSTFVIKRRTSNGMSDVVSPRQHANEAVDEEKARQL